MRRLRLPLMHFVEESEKSFSELLRSHNEAFRRARENLYLTKSIFKSPKPKKKKNTKRKEEKAERNEEKAIAKSLRKYIFQIELRNYDEEGKSF